MGVYAIVAYKPREGKEDKLIQLIKDHVPILRAEGLVTESASSIAMRSKDGTIIEIFEWKSEDALQQAHSNKAVGKMWIVCRF